MTSNIMKEQHGSKAWLFIGGACICTTLVLWIMSTDTVVKSAVQKEKEEDIVRAIQPETVSNTRNLGMFEKEVIPLDLTKRVLQGGVHGAQFRGSKFVTENQNRWTLQLMKVSDEDIVRTYLQKREDRQVFNYLRLQDGKNPEQYVLNYGVFNSTEEAMTKLQQVKFDLPASLKVIPVKISTYAPLVNDLGSDETSNGLLRTVKLQKTSIPRIEPKVEQPKDDEHLNENTRSVTQSDVNERDDFNHDRTSTAKNDNERNEKTIKSGRVEEIKGVAPEEEKKPTVSKQWSGSGQVDDPF